MLGKKLTEIRKENKMSQEEFAELFNVSRQTVSAWENSKSYPDIETLIRISEKFNISLDILLKENTKMVKDIDRKVKDNKKLKIIITVLLTCLVLGVVILLLNNYWEKKEYKEDRARYQEIISNLNLLGFSKKDGIGYSEIIEDDVTYYVYAKFPEALKEGISANRVLEDTTIMVDYDGEKVAVTYSNDKNIIVHCNRDGSLKNENQNKNYTAMYNKYKDETVKMIKRMTSLFDEVYA